ncbi:hypothetical protein BDA99DRAFT_526780 [Phascolomyces articulosus]|uniref:Proteasome activator subunit 4 n=1 Tax=Phascolomyces articulosus TaxID=60185 RepID=A0AAD5JYJ7_9FUNG|nr:hypothetical protein BDA99DRAFT_526780 [Phascolomyces articulosus]
MDMDKGDIPESVVKDDQHTMKYYQALPYATLLDGEADTWLNDICTNLAMCVQARDFAPGAITWVKRLNSYISMKHSIPRETRAKLAELLFSMTFIPGMDTALMDNWASTCIKLIRKPKHLGPEDLVLPWQPLYKAIDWYLFPNKRQKTLVADSKHIGTLIRLLEYAQRFFPVSSSQEILDEFLPQFSTSEIRDALRVIGFLVLFLPASVPRHSQTHALLDETNNLHPKEYLPTLFSIWSMITNSPTCDGQFVDMVSRIAEKNISDTTMAIQDGEIGLFTRQQVKYLFTVGMRMMNLPVGSQENGGSRPGGSTGFGSSGQRTDLKAGNALVLRRKPERFRAFAKFIVYTMIPNGSKGESYVMTLLSEMIQATELYYHPSNHGTWTYYLTTFIQHLAVEFLKRWRAEEEEDCPTPQERRLTPELRKKFVLILRPLTYLSMFGKDHFVIGATESTMKALAWLEPDLIFPGLLERIYPSLETLTETHRTTSALGILAAVAIPLFSRDHYPAGGKHLMPLLHLATPGVDMNDPLKAITSLLFITTALSTVPIRDLTTSGSGGGGGGHYSSDYMYEGMDMDSSEENQLPREEEDRLCKATTGEMEEWVAKFLRRVFTIFENLPQIHQQKKQNGSTETGLTSMLEYSCDTLFGQLSDDLYDMALRMVMDFISEQVLPNAIHAAGLLCNSIASANPAKAAKRLIPLCINNISSELEHGAASTMTNSETSTPIQSDSTLHWYQCILYHIVIKLGPDLLEYKKDIIHILTEMITKCKSRRGFVWSAELLKNCLSTLLRMYPHDRRSLNPEDWNNEEIMNNSHMLWGKMVHPNDLHVDWHVPSQQEKEFAIELLETFLVPAMTHVREKIETGEKGQPADAYAETNDFCRHLSVIYRALRGSSSMCLDETPKETPQNSPTDVESSDIHEPPRLIAGYAFTDPADPLYIKAQKMRQEIGELINDALNFFLVKREDDLESLKLVIDMARTFMDDAGIDRQHVSALKGQYLYAKAVVKVPKAPKHYPRGLLVRRAEIHHLQRLRYNGQSRTRSPIHDKILNNLLGLSLSSYAEIRKLSQHTLSAVAKNFSGSKTLILPPIIENLKSKLESGEDKEQHANRIKGSLYLLRHRSILTPCLRNWKFIPSFILSLCGAQHEDKPSIQEIIRKVFVDYVTQFHTRSFGVLVPEEFDAVAQTIYPSSIEQVPTTKIATLKEKVEKRQKSHLESYQQLIASLLAFVNDPKVHWRYCSMAANLLELFVRPDMPQEAGVATFASACMHSELPPMRRIGVGMTTNMLYYIEQRTFANGNSDIIISHDVKNPLEKEFSVAETNPNQSEEEYLHIYNEPLTEENLQKWPLIDYERVGWYVLPKVYKACVLPSNTAPLPEIEQESVKAYEEFHKSFTSKEYWEKLLKYMSQEVSRAQEDMFNHANVCLYLSIFRMYQDEPIETMKENLVTLCQSSDQKAHQRAAAELAAGLVNATIHWPQEKTDALWTWLIPLIETTFSNITPDTLIYWESFVRVCSHRRDPRRIRPLVNLILGAKVDPTSDASFVEARKLILAHVLINSLGWRANPLIDPLLGEYMNHIDHPYKQVREVLGDNISSILQRQWIPNHPDIKTLLQYNASPEANGGVGNVPIKMDPKIAPHVEQLLTKLDQWQVEAKSATEVEGTKTYTNASKTTLCWLRQSLGRYRVVGTLPYIIPFWSRLFAMQEFHDDQDLQQMATRTLHMVAQYSYPPSVVVHMVNEFVDILTHSESWRIRTRALPLLQIFFFKYLFSLESDHVLQVMNSVSSMLLDTQIEVRQMAAITLGGLVRCSQREAITTVKEQYSKLLEIKLPKRRRDRDTGKIIEVPGFADALLKKHAGVLGLSCLVNAFPYEVPKWMPNVLCQLANCMSDPAEIQSTIRKTFSDFRRTHSDTWHEDMSKFTEDQLSILSDMLISPSYYA